MNHWNSPFLLAGIVATCVATAHSEDKAAGPLSFKMKSINGPDANLAEYKGKVVLMVNVASQCGLTYHYKGLEAIYEKYKDRGLVVLGFPCNQFGSQEPGTDQEIVQFCTDNYKVTFPMFSKIEVNGSGAAPLYKYLTALDTKPQGKGKISWNFEKFLVGRNGQVVARFAPNIEPDSPEILAVVEGELAKK
jgi:glutathione peroxidase